MPKMTTMNGIFFCLMIPEGEVTLTGINHVSDMHSKILIGGILDEQECMVGVTTHY